MISLNDTHLKNLQVYGYPRVYDYLILNDHMYITTQTQAGRSSPSESYKSYTHMYSISDNFRDVSTVPVGGSSIYHIGNMIVTCGRAGITILNLDLTVPTIVMSTTYPDIVADNNILSIVDILQVWKTESDIFVKVSDITILQLTILQNNVSVVQHDIGNVEYITKFENKFYVVVDKNVVSYDLSFANKQVIFNISDDTIYTKSELIDSDNTVNPPTFTNNALARLNESATVHNLIVSSTTYNNNQVNIFYMISSTGTTVSVHELSTFDDAVVSLIDGSQSTIVNKFGISNWYNLSQTFNTELNHIDSVESDMNINNGAMKYACLMHTSSSSSFVSSIPAANDRVQIEYTNLHSVQTVRLLMDKLVVGPVYFGGTMHNEPGRMLIF